ncbi:beta-N-acetylglucosaminidase domain-containing protein [Actinopolymorpha sp. B11F2]|uniref:beta-N-acetylglucosaminidase domain-containing protein n=1 Tax=Actinopolymorpha sp. B11F2 TaxID=3160862 RepID=UPI0032E39429
MGGRERGGLVRRLVVAAVGVLVAVAMLPSAEAEVARSFEGFGLIGPVGIVRGADSDEQTEQLVRDVLARAGVRTVVDTDGTQPRTHLTVWLGDAATTLAALGSKTADALPADSYIIAVGKDHDGRGHVVLDGAGADGTFYAAHALDDLFQRRSGPDFMPPTHVQETPSMRYRGVVEGFYGTPWSFEERLDLLDFMGTHRMNTYEYAPKDDPYQRELWRMPYPAEKRSQLATLVRRARQNRVDVGFTLSPGLSMCFSGDQDFKALTAKLDSIYALGVRSFTMGFDDIDPTQWHCAADETTYADKPGGSAEAQAALLTRLQHEWANGKPDIAALRIVPTEYDSVTDSPYKKVLRAKLQTGVTVYWSGVANIPRSVSRDQAAQAARVFGHEIILWDNYPANDYIPGRIPLGAYSGRENGLSGEVAGVLSNPMNQSALSKIALSAVGEFGWDDEGFDPAVAWTRALAAQAGGDRRVAGALRWLADLNNFDGALHYARAPVLSVELADFWTAWNDGDRTRAAAELRRTLAEIAAAPQLIREGVDDPNFATQAAGWLDATELWARAMQASLAALVAAEENNLAAAADARAAANGLVERAKEIRDTRSPHAGRPLMVGDGVVDDFAARVDRAVDAALGIGLDRPQAQASMDTYAGHEPAQMLDGDKSTYYSSARAPVVGDFVQVDLRVEHEIGEVRLELAYANSPKDYLRSGVLEYSTDGETWTVLTRGDASEVVAKAPKGTRARYVRYRAAAANAPYWLVVREFDVEVLDRTTLSVDGGSENEDESDGENGADDENGANDENEADGENDAGGASGTANAAVDGDPHSSYLGTGPEGDDDHLVVTLSTARPLERVSLLQAAGEISQGTLEVRRSGTWSVIGQVGGTYTSIPVRDHAPVEALRLRWERGEVAPRVAEIVPHYLPD